MTLFGPLKNTMEFSQLITAGRTDILPGKKLAWFRSSMLMELARYFKEKERESLLLQAAKLMRRAEEKMNGHAAQDPSAVFNTDEGRAVNAINGIVENMIRADPFAVGRQGFRQCAFDISNLPKMLWMSLRVGNDEITEDEANALITPENENKIHEAILELMGYALEKKSGQMVLDRTQIPSILERLYNSSQSQENTPSIKSEP